MSAKLSMSRDFFDALGSLPNQSIRPSEKNMTKGTRRTECLGAQRGLHSCCELLAVILLCAATGCGGAANKYDSVVTGTVTIGGELAKSGTVTFHPVAKEGKIAIGRIYSDGSFSLRTGQGNLKDSDGGTLPSGEYIVAISVTGPAPNSPAPDGSPPVGGPLLIADKYVRKETSDLRSTVKPGKNVVTFDLQPAKQAEPSEQPSATPEQKNDQAQPDSGAAR
jgi:hypothetical protein